MLRVASITIKDTTFKTVAPEDDQVDVLWRAMDLCVVPAEQRAHAAHCGGEDLPAALVNIDVNFSYKRTANTSIIGPLTTDYPAQARSLQVLEIAFNDYDESDVLGALAALATHLRELTFWSCGLTSVRDLEGRCKYIQSVNLCGCEHLTSLDGLGHHLYLEEVTVSYAAITAAEPLRTCPALKKVDLSWCEQLSTIQALADHRWLQEVDASHTAITSIEALHTCPALTKVDLSDCDLLTGDVEFSASVKVTRE